MTGQKLPTAALACSESGLSWCCESELPGEVLKRHRCQPRQPQDIANTARTSHATREHKESYTTLEGRLKVVRMLGSLI
uniref:Uncharacterized protein n=1 Tax=Knipowitschia caucasica TaxID=637954 RepID=A0AAV2MRE9_KNICA